MEKFTICVIYKAKSALAREEFVKELEKSGVLSSIRAENGCLKYEYYNSVEDETRLVLFEEWQDKECQQVHMTQPHMRTAMEIKAKYIDSAELKQIKIS
ncbi:MAG: antibiotic biosynthesis monooxygenase [Clostridia bacterium]|nr:antibiotic biosynthesis monooxygenase [Clostridia bacterium]